MCGGPMLDRDSKKREQQYRAESDHRTLSEADTIRGDSKRHLAAKQHAKKQLAVNRRIAGGR